MPDPNGPCLSPDSKRLYVVSTGRGTGDSIAGGKGDMSVFDVGSDNRLINGKLFSSFMVDGVKRGPDGVRADVDGNLVFQQCRPQRGLQRGDRGPWKAASSDVSGCPKSAASRASAVPSATACPWRRASPWMPSTQAPRVLPPARARPRESCSQTRPPRERSQPDWNAVMPIVPHHYRPDQEEWRQASSGNASRVHSDGADQDLRPKRRRCSRSAVCARKPGPSGRLGLGCPKQKPVRLVKE